LWFVSDEIYHGLTYGMPEACALQYGDDAIVINSFSKYYCMTGWRIGWMIVPERLLRPIECLAQNLYISPPTLSQIAAIAAFDAVDELEGVRATYAVNRDLLLSELPAMGLTDFAPADGAFYLYVDVSRVSNDSFAFARTLLDRAGVAVTPGADFDPHRGHRYVRMSFAGTTGEMREACRRLKAFLA
jgi:aspartate/methionine/tyrosine aminotransferase